MGFTTQRVFKYEVGAGCTSMELPSGAEVLHVATQADGVFIWARVSDIAPMTMRDIGYFPTGAAIPEGAEFIGTAVTPDGAFVWHVFEWQVQF